MRQPTDRKRILFMAQLPPPVHGAALRNKSLLESRLINEKFDIINLPLKFIDEMTEMGTFSLRKIWLMLQHSIRMIGIFITRKPDLVYFTMSPKGGAFYRDILFISIIKLFRKKRILHFRVKGIKNTGNSWLGSNLVKYAFRGSAIIGLSNHHVEDFGNFIKNSSLYIVGNGIKTESEFLHLTEELRQYRDATPNILFLSNLSVKKGVPDLIAALAILNSRGYNFKATLVGGEWDMSFDDVNHLIRQNRLEQKVVCVGAKFGKEKFTHLAAADIFAFPTFFELFPGVILEAMQFGKAIVSTFEGSIPDIIDNGTNGLLVEQRNTDQLAENIAFLLDNPETREKMGMAARDKFFKEFTMGVFEEKMAAVFDEVLNKDRKTI